MKTDALQKLLRAYIAERDALYDAAAINDDGKCIHSDDAAALEHMDKIIDDAQAALAQAPDSAQLQEPTEKLARALAFLDQVRAAGDNGTGAWRDAREWVEEAARDVLATLSQLATPETAT